MKLNSLFILVPMVLASQFAHPQATLLFDQQSSTDETPVPGVPGAGFQQEQPFGQSFTPGFSSIGFVHLNLSDSNPGNGLGATLYLNLRSTSISGPILGTTASVALPDSFGGTASFFFPSALALTPGIRYYFEPIVQSGDLWTSATSGDAIYAGGSIFIRGVAVPGSSLWFREGIVVPEPPSAALLALAAAALAFRRHLKPTQPLTPR